jgi:hypothetical protein
MTLSYSVYYAFHRFPHVVQTTSEIIKIKPKNVFPMTDMQPLLQLKALYSTCVRLHMCRHFSFVLQPTFIGSEEGGQ